LLQSISYVKKKNGDKSDASRTTNLLVISKGIMSLVKRTETVHFPVLTFRFLKMEAAHSFETSGRTNPGTQHYIPGEMNTHTTPL
jgi:hypothetical protein